MNRIIIFAPNWLGDAVMALPAISDIRRELPQAVIAVAAKPSIAPLFEMVTGVDEVVTIENGLSKIGSESSARYEAAILLPNSFRSALIARQAGIAERWGYRADWRGLLLTRAVGRPSGPIHQIDYYQRLTSALGFPSGPNTPRSTLQLLHRLPERARSSEPGGTGGNRSWSSLLGLRTAARNDGPQTGLRRWRGNSSNWDFERC